jgi:tetratricopeptide (TPR) repeat protein
MIRSLTPLLSETDLARLKPQPGRPWSLEGTLERGQKAVADGRPVEALFAAALLRTAQQFHECAELLQLIRQSNPVGLNDMIANEEAALAWQRGDHDRAAELWARHPRQDSPVVQFNRGLAALFVNDRESARELFGQAAAALPESSAWHHLAKLYLTLGRQATV